MRDYSVEMGVVAEFMKKRDTHMGGIATIPDKAKGRSWYVGVDVPLVDMERYIQAIKTVLKDAHCDIGYLSSTQFKSARPNLGGRPCFFLNDLQKDRLDEVYAQFLQAQKGAAVEDAEFNPDEEVEDEKQYAAPADSTVYLETDFFVKHPISERAQRAEIAKGTFQYINQPKNLEYIEGAAAENLRDWQRTAVPPSSDMLDGEPEVEVANEDWGIAAGDMAKKYGVQPVALNMANATSPGGGWLTGAAAQEENMARRTTFALSILTSVAKVIFGKKGVRLIRYLQDIVDRINGKGDSVFFDEKPVICFRGPEDRIVNPDGSITVGGYKFLDKNEIFSFKEVRLAATERPARYVVENGKYVYEVDKDGELIPDGKGDYVKKIQSYDLDEAAEFRHKIENLFNTLIHHGEKYIVLSALGCGAFNNPPRDVARIFFEVLKEKRHHFHAIKFAVYCPKPTDAPNFLAFEEALDKYKKEIAIEKQQKAAKAPAKQQPILADEKEDAPAAGNAHQVVVGAPTPGQPYTITPIPGGAWKLNLPIDSAALEKFFAIKKQHMVDMQQNAEYDQEHQKWMNTFMSLTGMDQADCKKFIAFLYLDYANKNQKVLGPFLQTLAAKGEGLGAHIEFGICIETKAHFAQRPPEALRARQSSVDVQAQGARQPSPERQGQQQAPEVGKNGPPGGPSLPSSRKASAAAEDEKDEKQAALAAEGGSPPKRAGSSYGLEQGMFAAAAAKGGLLELFGGDAEAMGIREASLVDDVRNLGKYQWELVFKDKKSADEFAQENEQKAAGNVNTTFHREKNLDGTFSNVFKLGPGNASIFMHRYCPALGMQYPLKTLETFAYQSCKTQRVDLLAVIQEGVDVELKGKLDVLMTKVNTYHSGKSGFLGGLTGKRKDAKVAIAETMQEILKTALGEFVDAFSPQLMQRMQVELEELKEQKDPAGKHKYAFLTDPEETGDCKKLFDQLLRLSEEYAPAARSERKKGAAPPPPVQAR